MHKNATPRWYRVILALGLLMAIAYILVRNNTFDSINFTNNVPATILLFTLIVLLIVKVLWKYSSPYWKTRDKMLHSVTGKRELNSSQQLAALVIVISLLVVIILLTFFSPNF